MTIFSFKGKTFVSIVKDFDRSSFSRILYQKVRSLVGLVGDVGFGERRCRLAVVPVTIFSRNKSLQFVVEPSWINLSEGIT